MPLRGFRFSSIGYNNYYTGKRTLGYMVITTIAEGFYISQLATDDTSFPSWLWAQLKVSSKATGTSVCSIDYWHKGIRCLSSPLAQGFLFLMQLATGASRFLGFLVGYWHKIFSFFSW